MNFYKKLIKSRKLRFRIISLFRFVPDKTMVSVQYRIKCGRKLNLKDPKVYDTVYENGCSAKLAIFPIVGGAIGGAISGALAVVNLMVVKNIKNIGGKILVSIGIFVLTVAICATIAFALLSTM